jgi:trans-2,3-dihydro-3-hydroxyanthranilate isomerase
MNPRDFPFFIVDVFAENKYEGNQLAVFTESHHISSDEMAAIARETNFSETTFITRVDAPNSSADVRIFTPGGEIPFAGHPTLGTAYVVNKLFLGNTASRVVLNMKVGSIPVEIEDELLWMTQVQPEFGNEIDKEIIAEVLNISVLDILPNFPVLPVSTGLCFYIVPLANLDVLKSIRFNSHKAQALLSGKKTKEILVFTPEGYNNADDLACRVFVPTMGIPEDPATGSANGCLAAYLLKENFFNKNEIDIQVGQGYEINRPSRLYHKSLRDKGTYTIKVGGKVQDVARGYWD